MRTVFASVNIEIISLWRHRRRCRSDIWAILISEPDLCRHDRIHAGLWGLWESGEVLRPPRVRNRYFAAYKVPSSCRIGLLPELVRHLPPINVIQRGARGREDRPQPRQFHRGGQVGDHSAGGDQRLGRQQQIVSGSQTGAWGVAWAGGWRRLSFCQCVCEDAGLVRALRSHLHRLRAAGAQHLRGPAKEQLPALQCGADQTHGLPDLPRRLLWVGWLFSFLFAFPKQRSALLPYAV